MVELAKQLGYGARVGAMQANFGTPFENGITDLQAELEATETELAEARAALEAEEDPARTAELETEIQELEHEIEDLEGRLDQAIADAKPGKGPNDSWATADLDVNDDGVVDPADLEALETADGEGETTAGAEPGTDETSS